MAEEDQTTENALFPERIGDRLRAARVKAGLDLSDIAARTRVPLRHLTAIEAGDYAVLPSATYSVGFVKSYARALGLDEAEAASHLRDEMGLRTVTERLDLQAYEDEESGPLAPRWLAWTAAGLFAVLAIGYGALWGNWFGGSAPTEAVATTEPEAPVDDPAVPAPAAPVNTQGEVGCVSMMPATRCCSKRKWPRANAMLCHAMPPNR
jgi:cytoskeleton protein RodZ